MLDTGSAINVISEEIVSFLTLPTTTKLITLKTVDNYDTQDRKLADFQLESLDGLYTRAGRYTILPSNYNYD